MTTQDAREELVNQIALSLKATWERVESPHSASYVATFVDMARDLLDSAAIPTPAQVVADAKAEAWDEGYDRGLADGRSGSVPRDFTPNPYRAALGGRDA
jgi:hypothetical protein